MKNQYYIVKGGVSNVASSDGNQYFNITPNSTPFIIKVNSGPNGKFYFYATSTLTYDYNLTTSDGQTILNQTGDYEITFPNTNTDYIIEITGVFPRMYGDTVYSDNYNIIDVLQWGNQPWTTMASMFINCDQLSSFSATDVPDLSNVTSMTAMFRNSSFNGDINNWDVSNITNMNSMFYDSQFNQNIGNWDVSNVTNMSDMFTNSTFNGDISNWDVGVTNMDSMFRNSSFNGDISNWDVSNVTNMNSMFFATSSFNQDLSSWCVQNIPTKPLFFDDGASSWVLPRPVWGTCPP